MSWTIMQADASHIPLADKSVQCVVTSPPYWGLRDYGQEGQIGLEKTPEAYVAKIVAVFEEVKRVLRDDGTCWVNLGDSYASGEIGRHDRSNGYEGEYQRATKQGERQQQRLRTGLKPKDLVGIPWRVAFALQAAGWYLRSDIIWSKPNPMPESVTDRPTKAHEYIFLLTKKERYFFDQDAVREEATDCKPRPPKENRWADDEFDHRTKNGFLNGTSAYFTRNIRTVWEIATQPFSGWTKTVQWNRVLMDAVDDGNVRIVSKDCLKHGGQFVLPSSALCDEHAAELLIHNFDTYARLVRARLDDSSPIAQLLEHWTESDNSGFLFPACVLSASDHNNENHKKVHALLTNPSCIVCGKKPHRTADKITELLKDGSVVRRLLSNTSPGDWAYHPLVEIVSDNEHISSCCCAYYNKETAETSHFATFPEEIAKRCILAGTSERGACKECGAPWERVVKASGGTIGKSWHNHEDDLGRGMRGGDNGHNVAADLYSTYKRETTGWQPTCKHDAPTVAQLVLDPFSGAGTVPLVADKLNRRGIGLELKSDYCRMASRRCYDDAPLLGGL